MKCKLTLAYQNVFGDTTTVIKEYNESETISELEYFVCNLIDVACGVGFVAEDLLSAMHELTPNIEDDTLLYPSVDHINADNVNGMADAILYVEQQLEAIRKADEVEAVKERMEQFTAQGLAEKVLEIIDTDESDTYVRLGKIYELCQPYCKSS